MSGLTDYRELLTLAERESELIETGDWEGLVALSEQRAMVAARLPARPPLEARELLEAAHLLVARNLSVMLEARSATAAELGRVRRARRVLRSYTGVTRAQHVDVRR